jgi:hypothetical protein
MRAQPHGKEILLVCNDDIGIAVSAACQFDSDMEAIYLARAAHILRRQIFNLSYKFNGHFEKDSQVKSVPHSLSTFVKMLLEGPSIDSQNNTTHVPAVSSISQLIVYNSVKYVRKSLQNTKPESLPKIRHNVSQETPLPLYLSMMLQARSGG